MDGLAFLKQFLSAPGTTGAVAPSSRGLAEAITRAAGVSEAAAIVEFGPGTGVFTEVIAHTKRSESPFLAIEANEEFVDLLNTRFPDIDVVHDSATHVRTHLEAVGLETCDCIVSGLPWAAFPESLQDALLDAIADVLAPGGRLATFAYLQGCWLPAGVRFKRKLQERFSEVCRTSVVWRNLPPAFVYYATK